MDFLGVLRALGALPARELREFRGYVATGKCGNPNYSCMDVVKCHLLK